MLDEILTTSPNCWVSRWDWVWVDRARTVLKVHRWGSFFFRWPTFWFLGSFVEPCFFLNCLETCSKECVTRWIFLTAPLPFRKKMLSLNETDHATFLFVPAYFDEQHNVIQYEYRQASVYLLAKISKKTHALRGNRRGRPRFSSPPENRPFMIVAVAIYHKCYLTVIFHILKEEFTPIIEWTFVPIGNYFRQLF